MGSGPFATNTVPPERLLLSAVFKPIAQTRMPKARASAPSLRDMVPPRKETHGDTLSAIRIVSSRTHHGLVQKTATAGRRLHSPFLRSSAGRRFPAEGKLTYRSAQTQHYGSPIGLVLKYQRVETPAFPTRASNSRCSSRNRARGRYRRA